MLVSKIPGLNTFTKVILVSVSKLEAFQITVSPLFTVTPNSS
ncbi:hypothetical protein [uncultured Kordia sp.]|nr:hypothetical protein [uncultured Kordia sp.]